jgi:hypothetical protein
VNEALLFFIKDYITILALLFVAIFVIGTLRTYISARKLQRTLAKQPKIIAHTGASLFGAITPFCSCSSIPLFMGFLEARIPLGVSLSFLITSPLVNEYMAVLMLAAFGWKVALLYISAGILLGIIGGMVLGRMDLEKHLVKDVAAREVKEVKYVSFAQRTRFGLHEATDITKKLWLWILAGVALGAIIHNMVPEEFFTSMVSRTGIFSVPLAVILGVPLYGSSAALVPVAQALFAKGVPLGTTLAFVMATAALSFPEAIILRRVMKLRLILTFFGVVAIGIVLVGYLLNLV